MKRRDAQLLIVAIARAIKQRFTRRADHDALVRRVAAIEQQLATLQKQEPS